MSGEHKLCTKHVTDNFKRLLPPIAEGKRKETINKMFGTEVMKDGLDSFTIEEFDRKISLLYSKWEKERDCEHFLAYLKT